VLALLSSRPDQSAPICSLGFHQIYDDEWLAGFNA
jgi:hypothetical protein